ncbi:MAG: type I secretion system permease/ATPase [Pseudomonadota bacterium]
MAQPTAVRARRARRFGDSGAPIRSVRDALRECRLLFGFVLVFGVAVNLLLLTGPLYMLQVYDRVLTSSSFQTLMALSLLVVAAYLALGLIDAARATIASKAGLRLERLLAERLVGEVWASSAEDGPSRSTEILRDVETYRNFVGGQGVIILTDLPFAPLFIAVIFLLHPWLGVFATISILALTCIAAAAQIFTRRKQEEAREASATNSRFMHNVALASESVRSMGMNGTLSMLWRDQRDDAVTKQAIATDRAAAFKSATKATRFAVQSLILGLGAYLVLVQELSAGGMIAASIILGRALAPIEQSLAAWSQYNASRMAKVAIDKALAASEAEGSADQSAAAPSIYGEVALEKLTFTPRGADEPVISDLTMKIPVGAAVGVVGPSGAGKTTLAKLIIGVLKPESGLVRIDGADIRNYDPDLLGAQVGYLPQDSGLLSGTIAENIARFQVGREEEMYEAAKIAGVHEMIQRLPKGYATQIGAGGAGLSTGQRQRVGLARAIFGGPKLLVLDEPNANLDDQGEAALRRAIETVSGRGATVLIVSHKASLLQPCDRLIVMSQDRSVLYGPKDAVMNRLARRPDRPGEAPKAVEGPRQPSVAGAPKDAPKDRSGPPN